MNATELNRRIVILTGTLESCIRQLEEIRKEVNVGESVSNDEVLGKPVQWLIDQITGDYGSCPGLYRKNLEKIAATFHEKNQSPMKVRDLIEMTKCQLLSIRGCGKSTTLALEMVLSKYGLKIEYGVPSWMKK